MLKDHELSLGFLNNFGMRFTATEAKKLLRFLTPKDEAVSRVDWCVSPRTLQLSTPAHTEHPG